MTKQSLEAKVRVTSLPFLEMAVSQETRRAVKGGRGTLIGPF